MPRGPKVEPYDMIWWLQRHGTALCMDWGEDPDEWWEVTWVTGGQRYQGHGLYLRDALLEVEAVAFGELRGGS